MISWIFSSDENWGAKLEIKFLKTNRREEVRGTKADVSL